MYFRAQTPLKLITVQTKKTMWSQARSKSLLSCLQAKMQCKGRNIHSLIHSMCSAHQFTQPLTKLIIQKRNTKFSLAYWTDAKHRIEQTQIMFMISWQFENYIHCECRKALTRMNLLPLLGKNTKFLLKMAW